MVLWIVLLTLAIVLSLYGLYQFSDRMLGRFVHNAALWNCIAALGVGVLLWGVLALDGFELLTQLRDREYAAGFDAGSSEGAAAAVLAAADAQELPAYKDGFADGYAQACDEHISYDRGYLDGYQSAIRDAAALTAAVPGALSGETSTSPVTTDQTPQPPAASSSGSTGSSAGADAPSSENTQTQTPPAQGSESASNDSISETETVYYTQGGSVLHRSRDCSSLRRSANVLSAPKNQAPDRRLCALCGS